MKLIIAFLCLLPVFASAQKLERNEIDKYTKLSVKETSWFLLKMRFASQMSCRVKQINGQRFLDLSVSFPSVFRIDEGDKAYFLFDNDSTVQLECIKGHVADYIHTQYASHWNAKALYQLSDDDYNTLQRNTLIGVRIGLGDEYDTFDNIKEKNAGKFKRALSLIQ